MRKTIQTLNGAMFVAGKGKECANAECEYFGQHYLAYGVLKYSLPQCQKFLITLKNPKNQAPNSSQIVPPFFSHHPEAGFFGVAKPTGSGTVTDIPAN
ncbi:hypothetical protein [Nostoc sp.]|uniref:hypothetical protein n=1 Tax=Nostoc sp. TaxID=1180 RepID=UPI002FF4DFAC